MTKKESSEAEDKPDLQMKNGFPMVFKWNEPTKYNPIYCEYIIDWGKKGKTLAYMCSEMYICQRTFYYWLEDYDEFKRAYGISRACTQQYWENLAAGYMVETKDGPKLNTGLYRFMMSGHFRETYGAADVAITSSKEAEQTPENFIATVKALEERIRYGEQQSKDAKEKVDGTEKKAWEHHPIGT